MTSSSRWSYFKKQLITHEDPGHIHKILGVAVLASYAWRFSMFGKSDMGFATYPKLTLPTILLHASLTLTSFLFKIPKKRISTGDRICKCVCCASIYCSSASRYSCDFASCKKSEI